MSTEAFLTPSSGISTPVQMNGNFKTKGIVVFSGGSAANNLVDVFATVREDKKCPLSYIIPISDNGGSSSELIRVFGGPGIYGINSNFSQTNAMQVSATCEVNYPPHIKLRPLTRLRSSRAPHPR
jgi:hypothetical protein